MDLTQLFGLAQPLSAKAAQLADRLLTVTGGIPSTWRFALHWTLSERALLATPLTSEELLTLARGVPEDWSDTDLPVLPALAVLAEDSRSAFNFVAQVRKSARTA